MQSIRHIIAITLLVTAIAAPRVALACAQVDGVLMSALTAEGSRARTVANESVREHESLALVYANHAFEQPNVAVTFGVSVIQRKDYEPSRTLAEQRPDHDSPTLRGWVETQAAPRAPPVSNGLRPSNEPVHGLSAERTPAGSVLCGTCPARAPPVTL